MMQGTFRWLSPKKDFGFIEKEGGKDAYFVLRPTIYTYHLERIREGAQVSFEIDTNTTKPVAKNIRPIEFFM